MSLYYDNTNTYSHNKKTSQLYIFEIEITSDTKEILRKIRNTKEGNIINTDDNINNNINKIKLTIFDFNNPENPICLKKKFNSDIVEYNILNKNNVVITLASIQNTLICNYSINDA
jgi:hypothetical protein